MHWVTHTPRNGFLLVGALASTAGAACGGREGRPATDTTRAAPGPAAPDTTTAKAGQPSTVALGDSIFHGQAGGGTCMTCHGPDAKGTQLAPDLTDQQWLNGDGSLEFIVKTVTVGVPKPKKYPAPMPPMGGASLTPDQVRAVAEYEYSLSHPS